MLLCTHLTVNTTEAFYIFYEVIMILLNYVKKSTCKLNMPHHSGVHTVLVKSKHKY